VQHPVVADALSRRRHDARRSSHATGIASALANSRLFGQCSRRELKAVAKAAKVRTVPRGTFLMNEGEPGRTMFVILSGQVRVTRKGRKVASLGPGEAVGELAVISAAPRTATVYADTDLEVAEISKRAFSDLIEEVPSFSRKLLEALAERVRELDSRVFA